MSEEFEPESFIEEPFNAADKESVNKKRKQAGRKKQNSLRVVEALMQHKDGRAWLWELIEGTDPYGSPVIPGDVQMTYYYLGQQNVGKRLLSEALNFEKLYILMAQEARRK